MKKICKIFLWALGLFVVLCVILLFICNQIVVSNANGKAFSDIDSVRYNQVGLLLGTTPQARLTKVTNYFFVYRIDAAELLYKNGKIKSNSKLKKDMLFGNKIKQLRDENGVLQRQLTIDAPMFSKI